MNAQNLARAHLLLINKSSKRQRFFPFAFARGYCIWLCLLLSILRTAGAPLSGQRLSLWIRSAQKTALQVLALVRNELRPHHMETLTAHFKLASRLVRQLLTLAPDSSRPRCRNPSSKAIHVPHKIERPWRRLRFSVCLSLSVSPIRGFFEARCCIYLFVPK